MSHVKKILAITACIAISFIFCRTDTFAKSFGTLNKAWSVFPAGCSAETYISAVAKNYVGRYGTVSCWDIENMTSDYSDCYRKTGVDRVRCFLSKMGVSNTRGVEGGLQPVANKTTCHNVMRVTVRIMAGQLALISKGSKHALITQVSATKSNGKWGNFKFHGVLVSGTSNSKANTGSGNAEIVAC